MYWSNFYFNEIIFSQESLTESTYTLQKYDPFKMEQMKSTMG